MNKATFPGICAALAVAAVVTLGTGAVAAEPRGNGPRGGSEAGYGMHGGDGEGRHQWMEKLNLTAEQKKKIGQIRDEQREAIKAAAEQLRAEHGKMRDMMQGDADDAQLREQHGKVRALRAAVGEAWFEALLKIRAVLTPDQRKQMGALHHGGMDSSGAERGGSGMKDHGMR